MHPIISPLIETIKTGDGVAVKKAKKQVEFFWHHHYLKHQGEEKAAFREFIEEIPRFNEIIDDDHRAYFIRAFIWAVWAIGEEYFEEMADFLLRAVQHPSGKVRQAAINTADILLLSLELPGQSYRQSKELPAELQRKALLINLIRFGFYAYTTEELMGRYYQPKYNRIKYVSSLPVGQYKSLQRLFTENIVKTDYWMRLYQLFLSFFEARAEKVFSGNFFQDSTLLYSLINDQDYEMIDLAIKMRG